MKRAILLAFLALTFNAQAETFYRAQGSTSVTLGRICVPEAAGVETFALDFDSTNLTIVVTASGNGVDTAYTYTGANIDDYDGTPPAWGNPPASALELEAETGGCITLHLRDEVFAVAGATEWTIHFSDSTTDNIMDWTAQVLAVEVDGSGLDSIPWNAAWDAEVQSEANDALSTYDVATETSVATAQADLDLLTGTDGATLATAQGNYAPATVAALATVDGIVDDIKAAVILAAGTCDSGSTTTCVDAARTEANDVWKGAEIVFTSGTAAAETSCVYDFVASSDTLTFWATVGSAGTGDYILKANAICETAQDETP